METSRDTNLAIFAALLVLFSAMLDTPLTITLAILCLIVLSSHQWLETNRYQIGVKEIIHWLPRLLAIGVTIFLSLTALDTFKAYTSIVLSILVLVIHLIPTYILLALTILAWYKPFWGGIGFVLLGLLSTLLLSIYILGVITMLIGLLFYWDALSRDRASTTSSQASQF